MADDSDAISRLLYAGNGAGKGWGWSGALRAGHLNVVYGNHEMKEKRSIVWCNLLRGPEELRIPMAAAGLFGVGFGEFLQFLPLLTERRGLEPAGLVYTV